MYSSYRPPVSRASGGSRAGLPAARSGPPVTAAVRFNPQVRLRWWVALVVVLFGVFFVRAFYLQVIRHNYYQTAASLSQLKEYEIPAARGVIAAKNGDQTVPLVLNEDLYTLFADPVYIKDPQAAAEAVQAVIGGDVASIKSKMEQPNTRYVVLEKKLSSQQAQAIDALQLKGIGTREVPYRMYPDGQLASQLLGFVNDEGVGTYGIEQYLDDVLRGTPGELKAITDVSGVPLPANKENTVRPAEPGKQVVLTLDVGVQQQVEDILKSEIERTGSVSGSVVVMEAKTGAITAMANYPTYNPAQYTTVEDPALFTNDAVALPIEVGSIMKALTAAAALDQGAVTTEQSYFDPSFYKIDDAIVRNVEEDGGPGVKTVADILGQSLNTGATWLLMQMGGGQLNQQGREAWYRYMADHYRLGVKTGIEQGFESTGYVPGPNEGYGLNLMYANTAFGQAMTATPLQMAAAFAATLNGGVYYQPRLIDRMVAPDGTEEIIAAKVLRTGVVRPEISTTMKRLLEDVYAKNNRVYGGNGVRAEYSVGGKTGTAQIAQPEGGYYDDRYNGTYLGFVGGNDVEYVISVRMSEPKIAGYAGAKAAAPVFIKVANMMIDNYGVAPKR